MKKSKSKRRSLTAAAAASVAAIAKLAQAFTPWLKVNVIDGPASLAKASRALVAMRELKERAETERKKLTGPLLDQKKEIDLKYKPLAAALEGFDAHLAKLVALYERAERERLREVAEREAAAAELAGAADLAVTIRKQADVVPIIEHAGLATGATHRAVVADKAALLGAALRAPELFGQYVVPDEKALNAAARAAGGAASTIPGVEFVSDTFVRRAG